MGPSFSHYEPVSGQIELENKDIRGEEQAFFMHFYFHCDPVPGRVHAPHRWRRAAPGRAGAPGLVHQGAAAIRRDLREGQCQEGYQYKRDARWISDRSKCSQVLSVGDVFDKKSYAKHFMYYINNEIILTFSFRTIGSKKYRCCYIHVFWKPLNFCSV